MNQKNLELKLLETIKNEADSESDALSALSLILVSMAITGGLPKGRFIDIMSESWNRLTAMLEKQGQH